MDNRETLELIKDKIDIVSLIGRYLPLKQSGKNYSAPCPFHAEKTPSFMVSPDIQRYKCFGCQKSGDIFTFLMEYEHIDFAEALEKLAKEAGVQLEKRAPQNKFYAILELINKLSAEFFEKQFNLPIGKTAKNYMLERGYTEEILKEFSIGYAPGDTSLYKYLMNKANFTKEQLMQSGLFVEKGAGKTSTVKDKFNKRIMFPIHSDRGKVVAFSGRILPGNEYGPKYLNSPETPIFHKRYGLFGIYQAKPHLRKEDLCILCEGQTDVISCHQVGVKNIMAPLGTALTDDQLELIKRFTQNVVLLFDSDSAGQQAVERAFIMCTKHNINTYATNTGEAKDLSELAQKSAEKVKKLIDEKQDAFTYLLSNKLKNLDISRLDHFKIITKYVATLLQNVNTKENLTFFIGKAEELTGLPKDNFTVESGSQKNVANSYTSRRNGLEASGKLITSTQSTSSTSSRAKKTDKDMEIELLSLIINYEQYKFAKNLDKKYFGNEIATKILDKIISLSAEKEISTKLKDYIQNEIQNDELLNDLYFNENLMKLVSKDIAKELFGLYSRIKKDHLHARIRALRQQLSIEENLAKPSQEGLEKLSNEINVLMGELNSLERER